LSRRKQSGILEGRGEENEYNVVLKRGFHRTCQRTSEKEGCPFEKRKVNQRKVSFSEGDRFGGEVFDTNRNSLAETRKRNW